MEPVPEEALPPLQTLAAARELIDAGRPFSAHEVLEARWKDCPEHERDLWQGLAQLCVAMTHAARGNEVGSGRLFERAAGRLEAFAATGHPAYGLDVDALARDARRRSTRSLARGGPAGSRGLIQASATQLGQPESGERGEHEGRAEDPEDQSGAAGLE